MAFGFGFGLLLALALDVDAVVSKVPPVNSEKLKSGMLRSPVLVSTGKYLSHSFWKREPLVRVLCERGDEGGRWCCGRYK